MQVEYYIDNNTSDYCIILTTMQGEYWILLTVFLYLLNFEFHIPNFGDYNLEQFLNLFDSRSPF